MQAQQRQQQHQEQLHLASGGLQEQTLQRPQAGIQALADANGTSSSSESEMWQVADSAAQQELLYRDKLSHAQVRTLQLLV